MSNPTNDTSGINLGTQRVLKMICDDLDSCTYHSEFIREILALIRNENRAARIAELKSLANLDHLVSVHQINERIAELEKEVV